jgi:hypothetical protein
MLTYKASGNEEIRVARMLTVGGQQETAIMYGIK